MQLLIGINLWKGSKCASFVVTFGGKRNIAKQRDQQNEALIH